MNIVEYLENSGGGSRSFVAAELRHDTLKALHEALEASGMTKTQLAESLGVGKSAVNAVYNGNGNVRVTTLAEYADALGYRVQLSLYPKVVTPDQWATEGTSKPEVASDKR